MTLSPNPRLQRTRSASPPSPLSRQPLGAPDVMRRLMLLTTLAAILLLASGTVAVAEDDSAKVAAAAKAVTAWAELMDAGRYEDCWNSLSESRKGKMPKNQWLVYMNGVRKPLGSLKSRRQIKAEYIQSLKNSPSHDGAIVTFDSSFETRAGVRETFGVIHDEDGQWRVGHYLTN